MIVYDYLFRLWFYNRSTHHTTFSRRREKDERSTSRCRAKCVPSRVCHEAARGGERLEARDFIARGIGQDTLAQVTLQAVDSRGLIAHGLRPACSQEASAGSSRGAVPRTALCRDAQHHALRLHMGDRGHYSGSEHLHQLRTRHWRHSHHSGLTTQGFYQPCDLHKKDAGLRSFYKQIPSTGITSCFLSLSTILAALGGIEPPFPGCASGRYPKLIYK